MSLLELIDISKHFGGLIAVNRLTLSVERDEIMGLIGPNGAGKTTVFNMISGVFPPTHGVIRLNGREVTSMKPHRVATMGLSRTFQITTLFHEMTVLENVVLGTHTHFKPNFISALLGLSWAKGKEKEIGQKALGIIDFLGLAPYRDELAKNLPHGLQRLLGIAIAVAVDPVLLLLDEPLTGMNREETDSTLGIIQKIREQGITILIVEHNMQAIMAICERIAVLNYGKKLAEGLPREIQENPDVIEAYLGMEDDDA
jgi:branched-chain amino acid transport system ATP-binding protein